jgi:hypothetical protein
VNDTPLTETTGKESKFRWIKRVQSIWEWQIPDWSVPLALLVVCILSYMLLIRHLGYYWDDFPFIWISQKLGKAGLIRYFFTNRPVWGLTYQVFAPLVGYQAWHWQIYALAWRWISAVLLWVLLRLVWPKHPHPALWASLLFIVYPGSQEQFVSVVYSHFFLVLSAFLASITCSILAFRRPRWYVPLTVAGLLLSAVNLLTLEYFFLLELIRPVLLWISVDRVEGSRKANRKRAAMHWLPYLILFIGAILWRALFYAHQTTHYSFNLLDSLTAAPLSTVASLLLTIPRDLWLTTFGAWGQAFSLPSLGDTGKLTYLVYIMVVMATTAGGFIYLFLHHRAVNNDDTGGKHRWHSTPWAVSFLSVGLIALLLAGPAFWLTGLQVSLHFPDSRFTLAFLLGASLLGVGLFGLLPIPHKARPVLLAVCLGFGVGHQFLNANEFRRDLDVTQAYFWQMTWRMPDIEPGTALLVNELPLHSTDNSLTAMVNWIYAPDNNSAVMDYYMYYPRMRLGSSLPYLESGDLIEQDYLAATFYGSTKQVVALYFSPPGCLRVLDPDIEPYNSMLPEVMRYTAEYATQEPILYPQTGSVPQEDIFGQELAHAWCYYFEKADLARQKDDWQSVAALGDMAFTLDDYPNDPMERTPFIEGYAHVGRWDRAIELSRESYNVTDQMQPVLCRLWDRIQQETADTRDKVQAMQEIQGLLRCSTG